MQPLNIEMKPEEFRLLQEYVEKSAGIFLDEYRTSYLASRLRCRLLELGLPSFMEYYGYLKFDPCGVEENERLLGLITNHETYFFREMSQLQAFSQKVLPEIRETKRACGDKTLRILSAGCSTGEEVYTLAMLAADGGFLNGEWETSICGVDIDQAVIERARQGLYGERAVHATPEDVLARHFRKTADGYLVKENIRDHCRFICGNILKLEEVVAGTFDVIFCRNVLIYFREGMIKIVAQQFLDLLCAEGLLFLGHAETMSRISRDYDPILFPGAIGYKRKI